MEYRFSGKSSDAPFEEEEKPKGALVRLGQKRVYDIKRGIPIAMLTVTTVGLLVKLGWCLPSNQLESINAARAAKKEMEATTDTKLKVVVEHQEAINAANEKEHETFRTDMKKLVEDTHEVSKEILRVQINLRDKMDAILGAPMGDRFHRGRKVEE